MKETRPLEPNDLYRLRLISDPRISPDGNRVAFVLKQMDETQNDYISNIYVVDRAGAVLQFTSGDKDSAPRWSPDGRYLAFLSARKDAAQIHLLPLAGGESMPLTERKLGAGVPAWSPDSTFIAFTGPVSTDPEDEAEKESPDKPDEKSKDEKKTAKTKLTDRAGYKIDGAGYVGNRRRHIFLIDVEARSVEQVTQGDHHNDGAEWSPDGQHLAFAGNRSQYWDVSPESDIYVMPRTGGEPRRVTSGGSFGRPIWSPDGDRLAFTGNQDPSQIFSPARLYSVNLAGADLRDEFGSWDGSLGNEVVSDVVRSHDEIGYSYYWRTDGIYFLGTECGESNIYRAQRGVKPVTTGRHAVTDFSLDENGAIAYGCASPTTLIEVFLRDGKTSRQLTHENDALLAEVSIQQPERVPFKGANGEQSEGWLLTPKGSERGGKRPLLICIHGGPQLAHGETFFFEYQFLAGQGFGVFFPNVHGSSSYGAAYQTSIHGDWGNLDFQDVLAGTKEVAGRPWVDPNRIGIAGGSYGGYMTLWAMSHSDQFRAGVSDRCLSNMVSFMGTSDGGWIWNRAFGVYPEQDVQKLWDMSPLKYVDNIQAPLLIIQYEGDDRTPLEQGEQIFLALRRLGKTTRFIMFPEESHGLTRMGKPSRRSERLGYLLDWFRRYL